MAMANDHASFEKRSQGADSDQNDCGGQCGDRRCRMHGDAERAMVGIGLNRMDVSDLDNYQQSQQGQAHQAHGPEGRCPRTITRILLELDQIAILYLKDT
jgi:hypothetical protein